MNPTPPPDAMAPSTDMTGSMDPRQKVALALQYQRGMGKQTPMGNMANTMLQVWNKYRTLPTNTPTAPATPGYPVEEIGGG